MEIQKVGSRGTLFSFMDIGIITNVYVINGKHNVYIIDTYIGPDIMMEINGYIEGEFGNKKKIVINSHKHCDHIWGNCLYAQDTIISHRLCKELIERDGIKDFEKFKEMAKGNVAIVSPNLTFEDRVLFEEDELLIYHSPGHTEDELSVIDLRDKVLFAGDNLERPAPFLMWSNLERYIETLEEYLELDVETVIGGHTTCERKALIEDNLDYVKKVLSGDTSEFETDDYAEYHSANMKWLGENGKK